MPLQRLDLNATPHPLADSIGRGLESLSQHKMQQLQRSFEAQNTARGLEALGFPQQQASAYSHLDPKILQELAKQKIQEPSNKLFEEALRMGNGGYAPDNQSHMQQLMNTPQQMNDQQPGIPRAQQ